MQKGDRQLMPVLFFWCFAEISCALNPGLGSLIGLQKFNDQALIAIRKYFF
jgi:hypothetical protein